MSESAIDIPDGFRLCVVRSDFPRALGPFFERRDPDRGRTMRVRVQAPHCNALGTAHGGFMLTVMDFAMSYGSYEAGDFPPGVTLSLTTNFLRPAPMDAWLEARVVVERVTKSALFSRCLLFAGDEPVASAQGVFKPVPLAPDPAL